MSLFIIVIFSRVWELVSYELVIKKFNWKKILILVGEEDGSWV